MAAEAAGPQGYRPSFPPMRVLARTRKISLIKEWRNVTAEVGDHQSMVA